MDDLATVALMAVFTGVLGVATLLGVFLAFVGFAQARNPQGPFTWGKRERTRQLHDWIPALRWAAPEQQADVFNQVTRLLGWTQVGMGLGLAIGCAITATLIWTLLPFVRPGDPNYNLTTLLIPQLAIQTVFLPLALGAALAFRLAARAAQRTLPATDGAVWQPRRARDYYAAWLWWALVAGSCGVAAYGAVMTLSATRRSPDLYPPLSPTAEIALLGLSAAILLGPLLFWLTTRWIVAAPPAITTPYADVTDEAEDYVRAQALTYSHSSLGQCVAFLTFALGVTLLSTLASTLAFGDSAWLLALPALFALALVMLILSGLRSFFQGRLGGRRTDWPWAPRHQRAPAPA